MSDKEVLRNIAPAPIAPAPVAPTRIAPAPVAPTRIAPAPIAPAPMAPAPMAPAPMAPAPMAPAPIAPAPMAPAPMAPAPIAPAPVAPAPIAPAPIAPAPIAPAPIAPAPAPINALQTNLYPSGIPFQATNVRIRGIAPALAVRDISAQLQLPKATMAMKKKDNTDPPKKRPGSATAAPKAKKEGTSNSKEGSSDKNEEVLAVPRASVKRIMKIDSNVKQVQQEPSVLLSKATEAFIGKLAEATFKRARQDGRATSLQYKDLAEAAIMSDNLEFLKYVLPCSSSNSDEDS